MEVPATAQGHIWAGPELYLTLRLYYFLLHWLNVRALDPQD